MNQKGLELYTTFLKKKQTPKKDYDEHYHNLETYLIHYLNELNIEYKEGYKHIEDYLLNYLPEHYPLGSTKLLESHLNTLKKFYSRMYAIDELDYVTYTKNFDALVYKGDACLEKYQQAKVSE